MEKTAKPLAFRDDLRRRLSDHSRRFGLREDELLEILLAQAEARAGHGRMSEVALRRRMHNRSRKELLQCDGCIYAKRANKCGDAASRRRASNRPPAAPDGASRTLPALPNYQFLEVLGKGGMGTVYRGRQASLDRPVAIKMMPKHAAGRPGHSIRLMREGMLLAKMNHAHVVSCIDFCEDDDHLYVVMEYVCGPSLEKHLERRGRLPLDEALLFLKQAVAGLDYANALGITHRDVKPANLLLQPVPRGQTTVDAKADYVLKVADLGLAFFAPAAGGNMRLTQVGSTVGTPIYMSTEQALAEPLDLRTDIYALGITFYLMLTGRIPFEGQSTASVLAQKFCRQFEDPRAFVPDLPPALSLLIQRMTARDKEERYATYGALQAEIARIERGERLEAPLLHRTGSSMRMMPKTLRALLDEGYAFVREPGPAPAGPAGSAAGKARERTRSGLRAILKAVSGAVHASGIATWLRQGSRSPEKMRSSKKVPSTRRQRLAAALRRNKRT